MVIENGGETPSYFDGGLGGNRDDGSTISDAIGARLTRTVSGLRELADTIYRVTDRIEGTSSTGRSSAGTFSPRAAGPSSADLLRQQSVRFSMGGRTAQTVQAATAAVGAGGGGAGAGGFMGRAGQAFDLFQSIKGLSKAGGGSPVGMIGGMVGDAVGKAAGAVGGWMNSRIAENYSYSLAADKMSVMYQQMTGMSQTQVQDKFRQPLTNYRLGGVEGINTLLGMQASTGISAIGQAKSVEAIRTISGFGYSAEDASKMISTLGSAPVANRMFMTMGTSLYGIGGKQNDTMSVIQSAVKAAGLTDPRIAASALQQGSATRARLSFMGVPEDMQDMIIQYAQQNVAFNKKGGSGMYDPSKKSDRELMGIEGNFATQKEESDRIKMRREENFYSRQADNFADLEKVTQLLTKSMGALEDKLSGIIGAKTSMGGIGQKAGGFLSKLGGLATMAGGIASIIPGGQLVAPWLIGGGIAATAIGGVLGDPVPTSGGSGSTPAREMLSKAQSNGSFKKLHPKMQERISRMIIASGGRVGFGGGYRDTSAQEAMFRSRHTVVTDREAIARKDYDHFWEGKYWKLKKGNAPAAPPGKSMHEIGLAADMTGDMDWIVANAHKYGLRHFKDVNGEAWHVQPKELPESRSKYEKMGAPWGGGGGGGGEYEEGPETHGKGPTEEVGGGLNTYSGMSTVDILNSMRNQNFATLGKTTGAGGMEYGVGSTTSTEALTGGVLSGKEIVGILKGAGFRDQDLINAVGITYRESRWNPRAYNGNQKTGDKSYGLFQINMLGKMGEDRKQRFGLSKYEDLFDPDINARAAKMMVDSGGWNPWGGYKGMSDTYGVDLAAAAATVRAAETGDPVAFMGKGGGGSTTINGGTTINISPVINIHGSDLNADLRRVARDVGRMLKQEVDMAMLRST